MRAYCLAEYRGALLCKFEFDSCIVKVKRCMNNLISLSGKYFLHEGYNLPHVTYTK